MISSSYQLSLQSNTSNEVNGSPNNFIIRLDSPLEFNPNYGWEVRLVKMLVPHNVLNITILKDNQKMTIVNGGTTYNFVLPEGFYQSPTVFTEAFASQMYDAGLYSLTPTRVDFVELLYNSAVGKFYFKYNSVDTGSTITFPDSTLYEVLGFKSTDVITARTVASAEPDIGQQTSYGFLSLSGVMGHFNEKNQSNLNYLFRYNSQAFSFSEFPDLPLTDILGDLVSNNVREIEVRMFDSTGQSLTQFGSDGEGHVDNVFLTIQFTPKRNGV